jgi:predicted DNA-binding protein with PD1-like motif
MKTKVVEDADVVTYVVVCDPGDEAMAALMQFARAERLEAAQVFPTLEAVVTETPAELRRIMHPDLGVALIDLDRSES